MEQKNYIQWTSNNKEIESLTRFSVAYDYHKSKSLLDEFDTDVESKNNEISAIEDKKKQVAKEMKEIEKEITKLTNKKDSGAEGKLQKLEATVNQLSKEMIKRNSDVSHSNSNLQSEIKKLAEAEKNFDELQILIKKNTEKLDKLKENYASIQKEADDANLALAEKNRHYQAALAGF